MIAVLDWALEHWFLIFLLLALGVFEDIRDFFLGTWEDVTRVRRKRRMKELRAQAALERARAGVMLDAPVAHGRPKPGPCVHRNVVPVVSKAEEVVAWLCRTCDSKLPAEWAVREEDL
jgi:hypothetical protein